MKQVLIAFALGIVVTLGVVHLIDGLREGGPRVPPWHPFELRSDLTLDDLVADGYRFSDMPCGMVHFAKTLGDTTIRYGINIDCEAYAGKYKPRPLDLLEWTEEEVVLDTTVAKEQVLRAAALWEEDLRRNPYWPFDADSVRKCHQHHYWRQYRFAMQTMDSLAIRRFVERNGGSLFAEQWNVSLGGQFMVIHTANHLTFNCRIERHQEKEGNLPPWEFSMVTSIPFLDHSRYEEFRAREKLKRQYYGTDQGRAEE